MYAQEALIYQMSNVFNKLASDPDTQDEYELLLSKVKSKSATLSEELKLFNLIVLNPSDREPEFLEDAWKALLKTTASTKILEDSYEMLDFYGVHTSLDKQILQLIVKNSHTPEELLEEISYKHSSELQ